MQNKRGKLLALLGLLKLVPLGDGSTESGTSYGTGGMSKLKRQRLVFDFVFDIALILRAGRAPYSVG